MVDFLLPEPLRPKASRWLRALHRRTLDAWLTTIEDLDAFAIESTFAVIAIRVLDDVFACTDEPRYLSYRSGVVEGQVVAGLELVRNAELHGPVVVEHDNERMVGVPLPNGKTASRLFPRWKRYDELPSEYRLREDVVTSRADPSCQHAYRNAIAGRLVIDTLLDAIAFFQQSDPSIVPLVTDFGGVFPLPDLACRPDERRSPDWPSAERWYSGETDRLRYDDVPAAPWREVTVALSEGNKLIGLGGWSANVDGHRASWVERWQQVARDVRSGYRYVIIVENHEVDLSTDARRRVEALLPDGSDALIGLPNGHDEPLTLDRLYFLEKKENRDLYRQMRMGHP